MSMTYAEALALSGISIPEHLEAEAEVPVLSGVQCQGDLMIIPVTQAYEHMHGPAEGCACLPVYPDGQAVPEAGIQVIHGEATGNTHWLHAGFNSPGVAWHRADGDQVIGVVTIPTGQSAMLVHTDEHGANGIGPGRYEIRRKRELANEIRYVED